LIFWAVTTRG